jgi:hypothetical protein
MSDLVLKVDSSLDKNITKHFFNSTTSSWFQFILSLDENIIKVDGVDGITRITFKSDEHKTWFILRWS